MVDKFFFFKKWALFTFVDLPDVGCRVSKVVAPDHHTEKANIKVKKADHISQQICGKFIKTITKLNTSKIK